MRWALAGLAWAHGLAVLLCVLLRDLLGREPSWLALAGDFWLFVLLPGPVFLVLGLLLRGKAALLGAAIPTAIFLLLYGPLLVTLPPPAPSEEDVTIMTFNVLQVNRRYQRVQETIEDVGPDVVALQELTYPAARALERELESSYPHQALEPSLSNDGVGVLSRYPILHAERYRLSFGGRLAQHLILDVRGQPLHLINVHLSRPYILLFREPEFPWFRLAAFDTQLRDADVAELLHWIERLQGPLVLVGDFNMTEQSLAHRRLSRHLRDAHREAGRGLGYTYPSSAAYTPARLPFPLLRIDYIFHSPELRALEAYAGPAAGSDHRPVVARLRFEGATTANRQR